MPPNGTSRKNVISDSSHRRFPGVQAYVEALATGGKGKVIQKILIANNGNAAVKAIRSIRRWAYETFGNEKAISFVVMATPEDLRSNAEYIRMGDVIVDVPGGSNNHNYANVTLIVELARLHGVQAVWAGWGHASENPALPRALAASTPHPIAFIGPSGSAMAALGDKIGSTIIAQSAGVPCIGWNGDQVRASYDSVSGSLPAKALEEASVSSATQAQKEAERIGFPVMIKASEGGGGKGIRKVERVEDVSTAYRQVCGEVPGSPIFIMKLVSNARHLEVQVLADEHGNAVALNGRDCSVQRRHQKIIEEGPPVAAQPAVWTQMEQAAVALAQAVGYANAGTVEYLYSESEATFYFLELNPRLQVEHPVTEMITGVNLPACQLQVAMGIPLTNIPEIRSLYGKNRFEDDPKDPSHVIDFSKATARSPQGHCIAVRITAENAEAGFQPTSGGIQELNFRSTPNVWGYFSMDSSGSIHEFADSQFGHLFASGSDREVARRNMVLALKELSIRGDISTTVDYISKLIELEDFVKNNIDTGWLDEIIKENVGGMGAAESFMKNRRTDVDISSLHNHVYVIMGATILAYDQRRRGEQEFLDLLKKGQLPSRTLLRANNEYELILSGVKYQLSCTQNGPNTFSISVRSCPEKAVVTHVRLLSDGGYLIDVGGNSQVAYLTRRGDAASGMRLNVRGANVNFSPDYDPTSLRTEVAGKLVKKLIADGQRVKKGEAYAEIEVMKMFMPLKVEEAGTITWSVNEGATMSPGDLLASLELDNPENVATVTIFEGDMQVDGWNSSSVVSGSVTKGRSHLKLRNALNRLNSVLSGYISVKSDIDGAMQEVASAVKDPMLPVLEIEEQLSVLSGRIPADLYSRILKLLELHKNLCASSTSAMNAAAFPADGLLKELASHTNSLSDASERASFIALTTPLREAILPYQASVPGVPGIQRALDSFLVILRKWTSVERWFCDVPSYADAIDRLRQAHKNDYEAVLEVCKAHEQLKASNEIVTGILSAIDSGSWLNPSSGSAIQKQSIVSGSESLLSEISAMGSPTYEKVALRARKLLMKESMLGHEIRKNVVLSSADKLSKEGWNKDIADRLSNQPPMNDLLFPLLTELSGDTTQTIGLVEIFMRRLYNTFLVKESERVENDMYKFVFEEKQSEGAVSSLSTVSSLIELTRALSSTSLNHMDEGSDSDSESNVVTITTRGRVPPLTPRTGVCVMIDTLDTMSTSKAIDSVWSQYSSSGWHNKAGPVNVLYIISMNDKIALNETSYNETAEKCENLLDSYQDHLEKAHIRSVTFVLNQDHDEFEEYKAPAMFTYRFPEYTEVSLYRGIDPIHAPRLDLNRVATNYHIKSLGSRPTATCQTHLYLGTPKRSALGKDPKASKHARVFVRTLSVIAKLSTSAFEKILVDALNALDLCPDRSTADNHLFVNVESDIEPTIQDPVDVERIVAETLKLQSERITTMGIAEVESRIVCSLSRDSPPIALRLVASNPTGYVHVMSTYVEAVDSSGQERIFKLVGSTKASLASTGDSSWEGLNVETPYPLTRPFDHQRRAALKSSDTLYCYDLPALIEAAVEQHWAEASTKGGIEGGIRAAARPTIVMQTTELIVCKKGYSLDENWTMADYFAGRLELVAERRGAGMNNVGMVAWLIELKTVEYPQGREIVLIANDITFKAGSFGTREDVVFKLSSEFARKRGVPRLYAAANAGARIGLSESVKKSFQVAFKDQGKPESGFDFLYLTEADYERLQQQGDQSVVNVEEATVNGKKVYRIVDIIGTEPDLGVENLKGSGLIAGETSIAYDEVYTLTVVLGRSVGIGAYLVRLGQRTIQRQLESPIILTGYQALNKLMGVDVYSTHDQLGGPGIMYPNGISHLVEADHFKAIKAAMKWLSFVPSVRRGLLPITDIRGVDDIERAITFSPPAGQPYDPRLLLTGGEDENGSWRSGFFDKGSFTETLAGWAKTVVVGRARLGGIPMGVIVTENRTVESVRPADPADVKAAENVLLEAGCVWFPNSAFKTATAIKDFRTEDLPLIVFANWRGFSGGQRDMFDEVLKFGSMIVDAFVAYEQPIFVFIPPHSEIRGGAWVVLDATINSNVMEMYAASRTAKGGVLEANGTASVKYRTADLHKTMHRLDDTLVALDAKLDSCTDAAEKEKLADDIAKRENALLPVYEQIAVRFCELHDTPGRMKAVGAIRSDVEWEESRSYFYWRLRRKLAEFDIRRKVIEASQVGRTVNALSPLEASSMLKTWFLGSSNTTELLWEDDKAVLSWMAEYNSKLEEKVMQFSAECVSKEVYQVLTSKGTTAKIGLSGIVQGISLAVQHMSSEDKNKAKQDLLAALHDI